MFFLKYRLSNKKSTSRCEITPPFKLSVKGILKVVQTIKAIFIPIAYKPDLDNDSFAKDTTHTGQRTRRNQTGTDLEFSPMIDSSWKCYVDYCGKKSLNVLADVNPPSYIDSPGMINPMRQEYHDRRSLTSGWF